MSYISVSCKEDGRVMAAQNAPRTPEDQHFTTFDVDHG